MGTWWLKVKDEFHLQNNGVYEGITSFVKLVPSRNTRLSSSNWNYLWRRGWYQQQKNNTTTKFVVYRHQACWEQSPHLQMVFFLGLLARYFWSLTYTWGYISYGFVLALGKLSLNVLVQYSLSFYCEIHPILLALIEVISSLMYTNSSICKFKREIWS